MKFWCLKFYKKNTEKLEEFLAKNLKTGQKPKNKWMYFIMYTNKQ